MSFKEFLIKLQGLQDNHKKIIVVTIVVIIGVAMLYFWLISLQKSMQKISKSIGKINFPTLETQSPLPDILKTTSPTN